MNLKEAFRFQNKLQSLMDEAQGILAHDANVTKVQNTYLRKKAMRDAENETTVEAAPSDYAGQITLLANFLVSLLGERERLCAAIRAAKNALPIDMDSETCLNAKRQEIARAFRRMADLRNSEVLIPHGGTGYCFNQEGNQVAYRCDVKRVTTINFDRNSVRRLALEMNRKADEVSAELDRGLVNSQVDYLPPFDVNDSFGEIFGAYADAHSA
ncbi:MAG: hypothetical protein E7337_13585 [Clostridiales bacterium]|nr:hypothetical protein [Clostridiales bacterium]